MRYATTRALKTPMNQTTRFPKYSIIMRWEGFVKLGVLLEKFGDAWNGTRTATSSRWYGKRLIHSHLMLPQTCEGSAKEFVDMDLEVLPHVLAWAGRDSFGHLALYQILRIFPSLTSFVGGSSGGKLLGLKRKCAPE